MNAMNVSDGRMRQARVKGLVFAHIQEFLVAQFGEAGLSKIISQLKGLEAGVTLGNWYADQWYPLTHLIDACMAIISCFYDGDISKTSLMGKYSIDRSLTQVYRFLFQMLEPSLVFKFAQKVWDKYYDLGKLEIELVGQRHAIWRVYDFNPLHPCICMAFCGVCEGTLEACGAKNIKVTHSSCVLQRANICTYDVTWS